MKWLLLAALVLSGCSSFGPLKPGFGTSAPGVVFQQSANPADASEQTYKKTTITEPVTRLPEERPVKITTLEEVHTVLGAAQKDTAREIGAKLSSLKGIVWVGVLLFVVGAASAFYPPLKVIVGSVTTSAVISAAGLALIVLPSLIVGNEVLILCIGVGAAGLYWFSHRHGELRGKVSLLEKK